MGMNVEQAAAEIREAVEEAAGAQVTDAGQRWIEDWCLGLGRGGEPRPDIFAADEDDAEISGLCARIRELGADGSTEIRKICARRELDFVNVFALRELEESLTGQTKLCDGILAAETVA